MAKKTYIGVNGVAKNVKNVYIGINGVAKKVKKMYVGVNGVAKECYSSGVKTVSWSDGTNAEILAMVKSANKGEISLYDYWSIGDERTIQISAITAQYSCEAQSTQSAVFVLMDTDKYELVYPTTSGRTRCFFTVGMKSTLWQQGVMYGASTSSASWEGSNRRTWANNAFRQALPSDLRPNSSDSDCVFKKIKVPTGTYGGSSLSYTNDYFALWAEKEVYGSIVKSNSVENSLPQIKYYETVSNRQKAASSYWLRSPANTTSTNFAFCVMYGSQNKVTTSSATSNQGISLFGCI